MDYKKIKELCRLRTISFFLTLHKDKIAMGKRPLFGET